MKIISRNYNEFFTNQAFSVCCMNGFIQKPIESNSRLSSKKKTLFANEELHDAADPAPVCSVNNLEAFARNLGADPNNIKRIQPRVIP